MRPSSPTGLGRIGHRLVFLLPGNPVSCLCAYDFFAGRAIRALGGRSKDVAVPLDARQADAQDQLADRPARLRARAGRRTALVEPLAVGGASVLSSTTRADGFVIVRDDSEGFAAGRRSGGLALCAEQEQFLQVLDRDEAERRFRAALDLDAARHRAALPLDAALGRVLAADVVSPVDVPSFDRSNVDGFAVVAEDTFGASEEVPRTRAPWRRSDSHRRRADDRRFGPATAVSIATGGMVPRGADAVVMVEHADVARHASCESPERSPPAAACRSPAPTSPPAKPCCAAASC